MTKKTTTAPVVKEEKPKTKRVRKAVKKADAPTVLATDAKFEADAPDSTEQVKPEISANEALLQAENECLKNELHAANVKIASITSDYNSLKDEYTVVKNQLNQAKEAHTQAKNKIASQNADYKAVCSARDQAIYNFNSVKSEFESYEENTTKELNDCYTEIKTLRTLATAFGVITGIAIIALAVLVCM